MVAFREAIRLRNSEAGNTWREKAARKWNMIMEMEFYADLSVVEVSSRSFPFSTRLI